MKTLLMTVGLPGSGKSTWAQKTGLPVVNPDSIRQALHGMDYYAPAEPFVWATAHLMVNALFNAGHTAVVLDATNISSQRRAEWRSKEWVCSYVCFKADKEECKRRVRERGYRDSLDDVIDRMARNLDWPTDNTQEGRFSHESPQGPNSLHWIPRDQPTELS